MLEILAHAFSGQFSIVEIGIFVLICCLISTVHPVLNKDCWCHS